MTKKFNAFTLAEVLITLGIIGVVAAMTMPTLINQTNGAQYRAAYKKALSAISQGVTLNVALDDESFADTSAGTPGETTKIDDKTSIASLLNSRMNVVKASGKPSDYSPVIETKNVKACPETKPNCEETEKVNVTMDNVDTYLFFNDSSMFAFNSSNEKCTKTKPCTGFIDVNGLKGPNKETTDATVNSPTDIYPVEFYDQTILPATDAAKAVLYGK